MPATNAPTTEDIIASVNAYVMANDGKVKELVSALRKDDTAKAVAQALINVGAGQKAGEVGGRVEDLERQLREANEAIEAKDAEITEARSKQPDVAAREAELKEKHDKKLKEVRERAETAEQRTKDLVKKVAKSKFVANLTKPDEQGMRVDDGWAAEVLAARFDDRFVPKDDYSLAILQPGEATEYDGETEEDRIAALARDARKTVPSAYIVSNADSGAGIRNGSHSTTMYDPQKAGKELAKGEKKSTEERALSFS